MNEFFPRSHTAENRGAAGRTRRTKYPEGQSVKKTQIYLKIQMLKKLGVKEIQM